MTITITAFEASPDEGQGLARDMRVRWALEELGLAYDVELLSFAAMKQPEYLARQPFGQIPVLEDGSLTLFETGAIILHLARAHPGLLPNDVDARERAVAWMFAALNTVEPPIVELEAADLVERERDWYADRLPIMQDRIRDRLKRLSDRLGEADWLEGDFTVGDLMMVMVLRRAEGTGLVEEHANLAAYVARGTARPAYARAFADQRAIFEDATGG